MDTSQTLSPTENNARINSMDIIRGVALCGILLMNINGQGLSRAYDDPTINGGATGWNLTVWWVMNMFFEGTMRGMFSMLFGAGIILFTTRSTDNIQGVTVTDAYFRRILWLFLFGLIHSYFLLWHGEILYPYALVGLFAFSFRHWQPRHLILGAAVLLTFSTALNTFDYFKISHVYEEAHDAQLKKKTGQKLSHTELTAIEKWDGEVEERKPSPEKVKADIEARQKGSYLDLVLYKAHINLFMQTYYMYRYFFFDIFAMFLMGMAFLKNGILKAAKSNSYYLAMVVGGYGLGLTTNYFESDILISNQFSVITQALTAISYDFGRVFTTIGQVGLIMLFVKSGILPFLQKALAAIGQMAFTNYVMQTLITTTLFMGFGFGLYGILQRYQLYYIVAGIWILQLMLSPIWLHFFRFGPLEWAWRSLTYWQKQPFRK